MEYDVTHYAIDGKLAGPAGDKCYRIRDAIALSEELGRPLTEEEMEQFLITDGSDDSKTIAS